MKNGYHDKALTKCLYLKHAMAYGYREAMILFHFIHFINLNRKKEKHYHKGLYWTYSSIQTLHDSYFPFFSTGQIKRSIDLLVSQDVVLKDNFNKMKYDRTKWYALKDENGLIEMAQPFIEDDRWSEIT